jgi:hypothetical protein
MILVGPRCLGGQMFDEILQTAQSCAYDFRQTACPKDPLRHLFEVWVPYYRTKWAIVPVLQPKTILEIGVRFGYSALAFLNACPRARYLATLVAVYVRRAGLQRDSGREPVAGDTGEATWGQRPELAGVGERGEEPS